MNGIFSGRCWRQSLLLGLWLTGSSATSATTGGEAVFNVDSPSVMAIRKSLVERHALLKEHFQAGVIGLTHDGLVAMREPGRLAQDLRATIDRLVTEENKDRSTMYREIARANGRPDWESQFQFVFAERWLNRAPADWYHRDAGGQWTKILSGGAKDGPPEKALPVAPAPGK